MVEILQTLEARMETQVNEVIASIPEAIRATIAAIPIADIELRRAAFGQRLSPIASPSSITPEVADELRELLMMNPGESPRDFETSVTRYVALKAALCGDLLAKATPEQMHQLQDIGCTIACARSAHPFIKGWKGTTPDFDFSRSAIEARESPSMMESATRLNEYAALYLAIGIASSENHVRAIRSTENT